MGKSPVAVKSTMSLRIDLSKGHMAGRKRTTENVVKMRFDR